MKPISVKNEEGETIEIKWDADGNVKIRHSDIDPKQWGDLHELTKKIRQPGPHAIALEVAQAQGVDLESPEAKELMARMGGYMLIRGTSYIVGADELKLIYDAVKQAGGVVPNWSNSP
jgi:YD repeat-containing protein